MQSHNLNLEIVLSEREDVAFTYYECEAAERTLTVEGGAFQLGDAEAESYFKRTWNRGVMFDVLSAQYNRAKLEIPATYAENLKISCENGYIILIGGTYKAVDLFTDNAYIQMSDVTCETISLRTTNGMIGLEKVNAQSAGVKSENGYLQMEYCMLGELHAGTTNGAVSIEGSTATKLDVSTTNGLIELDSVSSDELRLVTTNGAIEGEIIGRLEDYRTDVSTDLGSCNIPVRTEGSKYLYARTTNGKIDLEFTRSED